MFERKVAFWSYWQITTKKIIWVVGSWFLKISFIWIKICTYKSRGNISTSTPHSSSVWLYDFALSFACQRHHPHGVTSSPSPIRFNLVGWWCLRLGGLTGGLKDEPQGYNLRSNQAREVACFEIGANPELASTRCTMMARAGGAGNKDTTPDTSERPPTNRRRMANTVPGPGPGYNTISNSISYSNKNSAGKITPHNKEKAIMKVKIVARIKSRGNSRSPRARLAGRVLSIFHFRSGQAQQEWFFPSTFSLGEFFFCTVAFP